jgi:ElaB/YqjD/DUF883 family membrane-anchored ribosome-binding protein
MANSKQAAKAATMDTADRIAQSAHEGIDAVTLAAQPAIERVAAGAHHAVDSAEEFIKPATDALEKAGIKSDELLAQGTAYVREHPFKALGMAVAAGYLLNSFLNGPRR